MEYIFATKIIERKAAVLGLKDANLAEDLRSDLVLHWMERGGRGLKDAWAKGKIDDYIFVAVKRQLLSRHSQFYRTYRKMKFVELNENINED